MDYSYSTAERVATADERTTLEAFLDHYRAAVCNKVRGVSDDDATCRLVRSRTTVAGLLKHLRRVEASWFQHRLAQLPADELPVLKWIVDEPDGDFRLQSQETVEAPITDYESQCDISRATAARFHLDDIVPHPGLGEVSLRWIYVHTIEETALHLGHADVLREQLDGARATDADAEGTFRAWRLQG